ncbi:hypothetical protein TA3x_005448 [Tundrisphaera sp. TA3]|uniref:hypothetical protein n=1 Tax=Tundrisphaera sp. TA3 TaxID=3435775 RepID=UPI003EBA35F4
MRNPDRAGAAAPPCDACPVAPGRTCLGLIHPPVCDDIRRGKPGRAAQLRRLSLRDPGGRPPTDPGDIGRIDADLCPHGAGACGCGAEPRLCGHPDRPAEVWRPDCLRCVELAGWEGSIGAIA